MDTDQITLVSVLTVAATLVGVVLTAVSAFVEHLRWKRTFKLEERKWAENFRLEKTKWEANFRLEKTKWEENFRLEERKWAEDLNNKIRLEMIKVRIEQYPRIIKELEPFSQRYETIPPEVAREVGDRMHAELYKRVVASMEGDTRKALDNLRNACYEYADGRRSLDGLRQARSFLLTNLFRDLATRGKWGPDVTSLTETVGKEIREGQRIPVP